MRMLRHWLLVVIVPASVSATLIAACTPPSAPPLAPVDEHALFADVPDAAAPGLTADDFGDAGTPVAKDEASGSETALRDWTDHGKSRCSDFDYFPNGGIQNFWCHRPDGVSIAALQARAGVSLFVSGPHRDDELVLNSANDFGHYNPAFVRWLVDSAGASPRGSVAQRATQGAYDASLKPLAAVFYQTLVKIRADAKCFTSEKQAYAALIARKKLPADYYERWYSFMSPKFCSTVIAKRSALSDDGGVSGNVAKTVVGFWIRRSLDGTMDDFADGLTKLVTAYDPALLDGRVSAPPERHKTINLQIR